MNKGELLNFVKNSAVRFRDDRTWFERNKHMHDLQDRTGPIELPQQTVDAVLSGFINHMGMEMGVDYGIYARDLETEAVKARLEKERGERLKQEDECGHAPWYAAGRPRHCPGCGKFMGDQG